MGEMVAEQDDEQAWPGWIAERTARVDGLLAAKRVHWVDAQEVLTVALSRTWQRHQRSPVESFFAYAWFLVPTVINDLQFAGRRKSRALVPIVEVAGGMNPAEVLERSQQRAAWVDDEASVHEVGVHDEADDAMLDSGDFEGAGERSWADLLTGKGSNAEAAVVARIGRRVTFEREPTPSGDHQSSGRATIDGLRRQVSSWMIEAKRTGDRDARFGDPFAQATAFLYLLMFTLEPLDERFWPAGYPAPGSDVSGADLDLGVALWLTDRDWFPAAPANDTERRRVRRARQQVRALAGALGLDGSEADR